MERYLHELRLMMFDNDVYVNAVTANDVECVYCVLSSVQEYLMIAVTVVAVRMFAECKCCHGRGVVSTVLSLEDDHAALQKD